MPTVESPRLSVVKSFSDKSPQTLVLDGGSLSPDRLSAIRDRGCPVCPANVERLILRQTETRPYACSTLVKEDIARVECESPPKRQKREQHFINFQRDALCLRDESTWPPSPPKSTWEVD